jgi:hypothetical protein
MFVSHPLLKGIQSTSAPSILLGHSHQLKRKHLFCRISIPTKKTTHVGGRNGDVLFSRGATPKVSSELKSLTSVFGMGTGVPSSLLSPVHLHIQAASLDRMYIIIVRIDCQ